VVALWERVSPGPAMQGGTIRAEDAKVDKKVNNIL
jgi:hypothetical protein